MAEIVTDEMRATCLEARDDIIGLVAERDQLQAERDEARSEILRLELCLSCVLPIAEKVAAGVDARTCALIRQSLGKPPLKRKPELRIVESERSGA